MSKAHSGTESSTADQLRCPACDHTGRFSLASDGELRCPDCGARVTRGPTGVEYGHRAGHEPDKNDGERCARRSAVVDTDDGRVKSALSMHESLGIGRFADASD